MFAYYPADGENLFDADRRISGEAFFPVKEQKLYFKNLEGEEGSLFEKALYPDLPMGAALELKRHFGILDVERRNVICCVTYDNYELIQNSDAVDIARKHILPAVFKGEESQHYLCNGLLISNSRGQSYIDMYSLDYVPPIKFEDVWLPFIRIANSYNRSLKLSYCIGFYHRNTHNRIIFSDRTIDLDTIHKGVEEAIKSQMQKNFSDIDEFDKKFYEGLVKLSKYFFPKKLMLQMVCRVFGYGVKWARGRGTDGTIARNHEIVCNVLESTYEFFEHSGDSAYSAFCVLTAFATRPPFDLQRMMVNQMDRNQCVVGAWSAEFVEKMSQPSFNIGDYLDDESARAADVLAADYASVEQKAGKVDDLFESGMSSRGEKGVTRK